jgi:hypothetical protein
MLFVRPESYEKEKDKKFYQFLQLLLYCENMKVMWH